MPDYRELELLYRRQRLRIAGWIASGVAVLLVFGAAFARWAQDPPLEPGATTIARVVGLHGYETYGPADVSLLVQLEDGRVLRIGTPPGTVVAKGTEVILQEMITQEGRVHSYRWVSILPEHLQRE